MGLDMYVYLEEKETKETEVFAYYRKFNALQGYFETNHNLENNGVVNLTEEIVDEVYNILHEVGLNEELASKLLPVQTGFFYGSYEYDKFYFEDVYDAEKDFYHLKFVDRNRYNVFFNSNW